MSKRHDCVSNCHDRVCVCVNDTIMQMNVINICIALVDIVVIGFAKCLQQIPVRFCCVIRNMHNESSR